MSEEETPVEAPEAETDPALEATPTPAPEAEAEPKSDPALEAKLKETAKEAQSLRRRLRETEAELKAKQDAELSEAEKLAKRAEEAEQALRNAADRAKAANLRAAVTAKAVEAGLKPDLALKLVKDDVEYDENDEPANVDSLISDLKSQFPELSKPAVTPTGDPANPAGGTPASETHEQALARIYSRAPAIDVLANPELLGGGVVYPQE